MVQEGYRTGFGGREGGREGGVVGGGQRGTGDGDQYAARERSNASPSPIFHRILLRVLPLSDAGCNTQNPPHPAPSLPPPQSYHHITSPSRMKQLTPIAILHKAARNQYSFTEYFVNAELKLQSPTVKYSSMDRG